VDDVGVGEPDDDLEAFLADACEVLACSSTFPIPKKCLHDMGIIPQCLHKRERERERERER